jgi:hypothetical protein
MAQSFLLWTLGNAISQIYEGVTGANQAGPTLLGEELVSDLDDINQNYTISEMRRDIYGMEFWALSSYLHHHARKFDFSRSIASGIYGGLFLGPVGNLWYKGLDHSVSKYINSKTLPFIFLLVKVLLDIFIFGPVHVSVYFTWMKLCEGATLDEARIKLIEDFVPTFIADSVYWIPIQILNFRFVPVPLQLTIVNIACIFECAGLSFLSHVGWGHVPVAHV